MQRQRSARRTKPDPFMDLSESSKAANTFESEDEDDEDDDDYLSSGHMALHDANPVYQGGTLLDSHGEPLSIRGRLPSSLR